MAMAAELRYCKSCGCGSTNANLEINGTGSCASFKLHFWSDWMGEGKKSLEVTGSADLQPNYGFLKADNADGKAISGVCFELISLPKTVNLAKGDPDMQFIEDANGGMVNRYGSPSFDAVLILATGSKQQADAAFCPTFPRFKGLHSVKLLRPDKPTQPDRQSSPARLK